MLDMQHPNLNNFRVDGIVKYVRQKPDVTGAGARHALEICRFDVVAEVVKCRCTTSTSNHRSRLHERSKPITTQTYE